MSAGELLHACFLININDALSFHSRPERVLAPTGWGAYPAPTCTPRCRASCFLALLNIMRNDSVVFHLAQFVTIVADIDKNHQTNSDQLVKTRES